MFGTKFPSMIPIAIARKIHSARNRSSQPKPLNADDFSAMAMSCFSGSGLMTVALPFPSTGRVEFSGMAITYWVYVEQSKFGKRSLPF